MCYRSRNNTSLDRPIRRLRAPGTSCCGGKTPTTVWRSDTRPYGKNTPDTPGQQRGKLRTSTNAAGSGNSKHVIRTLRGSVRAHSHSTQTHRATDHKARTCGGPTGIKGTSTGTPLTPCTDTKKRWPSFYKNPTEPRDTSVWISTPTTTTAEFATGSPVRNAKQGTLSSKQFPALTMTEGAWMAARCGGSKEMPLNMPDAGNGRRNLSHQQIGPEQARCLCSDQRAGGR